MSYLGKNIEAEKGFDLVPSNLITGIITEKGILDFQEIVEVMKDNSKFFQVFNFSEHRRQAFIDGRFCHVQISLELFSGF